MRKGIFSVLVCALGLVPLAGAPAAAKSCVGKPGAIGLSRVVEIDTSGGPRFGNMQYPDIDFLKPGEVVLTFDDGPLRKYTKSVLKALSDHCTKATFYMVGRMAVADPEMVREVARQGHTIGLHTWSHKNLGRRSLSGAKYEFELGMSAVSKALGADISPFFRFPYLAHSGAMMKYLRKRNVGMFSIDVDSLDFRTRSPQTMINRVLSGLKRKGKGILLFHDIQRSTAGGTRRLLSELKKRGYKVVHTISKQRATTLPEFDKLAVKELTRRKQLAALEPQQAPNPPWPYIEAGDPKPQPLTNLRKARSKKEKNRAAVPPPPVKRPPAGAAKNAAKPTAPVNANAKAAATMNAPERPKKGRLIEPKKAAATANPGNTVDTSADKETAKQTGSNAKETSAASDATDQGSGSKTTGVLTKPGAVDPTKSGQPNSGSPAAASVDVKAGDLAAGANEGEPKASAANENDTAIPELDPAEAKKDEDDTSNVASDLRFVRFRKLDGERDPPETSARMTMGEGLKAHDH